MVPQRTPLFEPVEPSTEKLAGAVEALFYGMMRSARRDAFRYGISLPQFMALRGLAKVGPTPTTFWAEKLGFSPSAVSEMIEGLVLLGYANRTHDTADRRRVMISLTSKGRRLSSEVGGRIRAAWLERLRRLTPQEAHAAFVAIEKLSMTGQEGEERVAHALPGHSIEERSHGRRTSKIATKRRVR